YFLFFFQAEDGIRDFHVTGVQTCALPIWCHAAHGATVLNRQVALFHVPELAAALLGCVQQSQRGVFLEVNGGDRVHHHTDFDGHSDSVITRCVVRYVVLVAQCTSVIVL